MDEEADGLGTGVPASMADLFFALIAVVVIMLLALAPAIRSPEALAAGRQAPWRADLRVGGQEPLVLAAERDGLRTVGEGERLVPLDAIFADAGLKERLNDARSKRQPILLFVTPEGGETVFLLDALAASLGVTAVDQVRLDRECRFLAEGADRDFCDRGGWEEAP